MKELSLILIALLMLIIVQRCNADNVGLDFGVGPNQIPSYGIDITKNSGYLYVNPGIMANKEVVTINSSFGLQLADVNIGIAAAGNVSNGIIIPSIGGELGYTYELSENYYIKDNNQLLRDNNNNGWFSSTLSVGVNF